jgi:4-alpha-glucanotransferase
MYPNWRRRLTVPLERWTQDGAVMQLFAALRAER